MCIVLTASEHTAILVGMLPFGVSQYLIDIKDRQFYSSPTDNQNLIPQISPDFPALIWIN
jgi:hypothetical protein